MTDSECTLVSRAHMTELVMIWTSGEETLYFHDGRYERKKKEKKIVCLLTVKSTVLVELMAFFSNLNLGLKFYLLKLVF